MRVAVGRTFKLAHDVEQIVMRMLDFHVEGKDAQQFLLAAIDRFLHRPVILAITPSNCKQQHDNRTSDTSSGGSFGCCSR